MTSASARRSRCGSPRPMTSPSCRAGGPPGLRRFGSSARYRDGMREALSLVVAAVMVAGLALVAAAPAGASRDEGGKKSRFCRALGNFDTGELGNPTSEKGAAKTVKELKKLRRAARGDTKDAINEIIDAYEQVADGESARKAFANGDFISAAGTFALASAKCIDLPDITLPDDLDLPDITLPDLSGN